VCKIPNPTNVARFLKRKIPLGVIQNLLIDSITVVDDDNPVSDLLADKNDSEITHAKSFRRWSKKAVTLQKNSLATEEFHKLVDLVFRNKDLFRYIALTQPHVDRLRSNFTR